MKITFQLSNGSQVVVDPSQLQIQSVGNNQVVLFATLENTPLPLVYFGGQLATQAELDARISKDNPPA